jgi:pyruvate dehydrogenase E1 component
MTTVAVSDYITAVPEMIQRWVGGKFIVLGTDGFGRSDDRLELRRFFEIDTNSIVLATVSALEREGSVKKGLTEEIVEKWGISRERFDKTH